MRQKENDCLSYKRNGWLKGKIDIETSELPLSTKRFNLRIEIAVRQTQTVAWQVNRVNIVMKSYALTDTLYLN